MQILPEFAALRAELPAGSLLRWASVLFSLCVIALPLNLAASEVCLGAALLLFAATVRRRPNFPPVGLPLTLFFLLTFNSMWWAEDSAVGWLAMRKLFLFAILLLGVNLLITRRHLQALFQGLFVTSAFASLFAYAQFAAQYRAMRLAHPGHVYLHMTGDRARGLQGHWMNFGGQQMLVYAALLAFVLLLPGVSRLWWVVLSIVALSIIVNFTRGVWVGCFVATVYLVARWRARWLWAIPVLALALYAAAPSILRSRLESVEHPSSDPSISIRFEMWRVGLQMIKSHPLVGVGPNNIHQTYERYIPPGVTPVVGYHDHLHNDYLQLAAERGLPCLAAWLWLMAAFGWHFLKVRKRLVAQQLSPWIADAALAGWLAFLVEGLFEFNFGTSPVLMVFLFLAVAPFAAAAASATGAHPDSQRLPS
ncbi:MAG TPA: O-antigen ligase family protein [Candidatus Acidoferrales bacterium]|jgi:O-antigen ligase|nr:O-antigen ligase family protein [Candidatus Acidoferrales bacterium]